MVSSEVQRTLVKSPPELWAELSDPASLARHLGELGEIRITKTKPEERIEWAAERISGTVSIKASGWGTKVTLSVTRETDEPEKADGEPEQAQPAPCDDPPAAPSEAARAIAETEPAPVLEDAAAQEDEPEAEVAPEAMVAPEPRRGFFSRLLRRRQPEREPFAPSQPTREPVATVEPEPGPERAASATGSLQARFQAEPVAPEAEFNGPTAEETSQAADPSANPENISAELKADEEATVEEVTAVLTAALDRLGAAHHRPFSRA